MTLGNCSASPCIKCLIKYVNFVELILSLGSMEEWTRYVGTKSPPQCVCCAPPCSSIWRRPTGWTKESRSTTAAASSAQVEMQSQQLQQSPEDGSPFFSLTMLASMNSLAGAIEIISWSPMASFCDYTRSPTSPPTTTILLTSTPAPTPSSTSSSSWPIFCQSSR